ncbi:MAG: adenylate/guanylate cyclase domain-containing protein [Treponema sp.]|nr:adenylate/guanylate cyclase domain-containing protein [Treponema sp.]
MSHISRQFLLGGLGFMVISLALLGSGLGDTGDRALFDTLMRLRIKHGGLAMNPLISPVDLNDQTLRTLQEKVDTREAFADLVTVLSGFNASQLVLDFLFQFPKAEADDTLFVEAARDAENLIMAVLVMEDDGSDLSPAERRILEKSLWHITLKGKSLVPKAGGVIMPFPALAEAALHLGHINETPDSDGIFRRVPLLYQWEDGYIPSLPLAAAAQYWEIDPNRVILYPGKELVLPLPLFDDEAEYIRIPVDEQCRMLIPYVKTWADSYDRIPLERITAAKYDAAAAETYRKGLTGQIALAAEVTTTQKDVGPTAFEGIYPLSGIHVAVLSSILSGDSFIAESGRLYQGLALLILFLTMLVAQSAGTDLGFHLRFLGLFILFTAINGIRWQFFHITPWYTAGLGALICSWGLAFALRLFFRYHEQSLLENALSRYFHHDLVSKIIKEGKVDLTPAYKELTILFSDISSFTKWSSDKEPEVVHGFLSCFHSAMADIIFAHQGTVDKFIGDGMLAFFGDHGGVLGADPTASTHVRQCLEAAMEMQRKAREIAAEWKSRININLHIRIGINTGKVIVGNLGAENRIEYTVIGAAVNLAQRMESNAPLGGILLTGETRRLAGDDFPISAKRGIFVKGYDEHEIEVYDIGAETFDS